MSDPFLSVRCPYCAAPPDVPCRSPEGYATAAHVTRRAASRRPKATPLPADAIADTSLIYTALRRAAQSRCTRCGSRSHVARECPSDLFDAE